VAKALLAKGSRITGARRAAVATKYAKRYEAGESIRKIAEDAGRSFGFVHGVLKEAGVTLRSRGGATRGPKKVAGKKAAAAPAANKIAVTAKAPSMKASAKKAAGRKKAKR
jgi:hypothetical protein